MPTEARRRLQAMVDRYRAHVAARDRVRDHLRDVERYWLRYRTISLRARQLDVRPQELRSWPAWLERNERLLQTGRAILDDRATYGTLLDDTGDGRERLRSAVSRMERFVPRWETLYDALERDWNDLVAGADRAGLPLPLVRGYDELIERVQDLAGHPQLPSTEREELAGLLDYHRSETAARNAVHDYLAAAERHVKACEPLQREAKSRGVHVAEVAGWPEWRQEAQRLAKASRAILADEDTYGAWLDAVAAGKPRARLTVDQLRGRIEDGRAKAARSEKPEPRRDPALRQEKGIAWILEDPEKLRELREQLKKRERKIGRQHRSSRGRSM